LLEFIVKKSGHLFIFGVLAASIYWAIGGNDKRTLILAWSASVLFAISDEYHQLLVPGRGSWVNDIGIDALGAIIGLFLLSWRVSRQIPDQFPQED
jgi:VanZ family protein